MNKAKLYSCKVCGGKYQKRNMGHVACSVECSITWARRKAQKTVEAKAREARREIRERKEKIKTRSDWIREAQVEFNKYIRTRDADKPCICCGTPLISGAVGGGFDAGHYRSVGSAPHLRFDERNCHGQTKKCNRYGSGRAVDYRIGLINRLGLKEVEALESDQTIRKYTIDELRAIRDMYRKKTKELLEAKRARD